MTAVEAAKKLQGPPGTKVKLQLIRNGFVKPLDLDLLLEKPSLESVVHYQLEDGYHYLRLRTPRERSTQELQQVLRSIQSGPSPKKGLILDLRNTAGGQPEEARHLASAFVGGDLIYSIKGRTDTKQSVNGLKDYQVLKNKLPLVILVDQGTAQVAEIMAGALQAQWGALLLGYKTFGDCSVTQLFPLKDGSALIVSVGYCYTPRDRLIQGKGLEPDVSGPKKNSEEHVVGESSLKLEKPKNIPDVQDVTKDPLVNQALFQLKNWGRGSVTQIPDNGFLRKNRAASSPGTGEEIS
jgi:carboxyl-terminal processing protease